MVGLNHATFKSTSIVIRALFVCKVEVIRIRLCLASVPLTFVSRTTQILCEHIRRLIRMRMKCE